MAREEILLKFQMLEQQAEERKQQIEELERQKTDMSSLKESLEDIEKNRKDGEILSNLGRGIFLKTQVKDDKVFVNVGSKTLVRKSFQEARELIDAQLREIEKVKADLMRSIEEINLQLYSLLEEAKNSEKN